MINNSFAEIEKDIFSKINPYIDNIYNLYSKNFRKVLKAFNAEKVSSIHLNPSFGYGLSDCGIGKIERVYSNIFNTETSIVRPQLVSGTHVLFLILNALLNRGDLLLSITGEPYETMKSCIGITNNYKGNLIERGVRYSELSLIETRAEVYQKELLKEAKVVLIQKSCGYSNRKTISNNEIGRLIEIVKEANPYTIIMVDNCYGEFVEEKEPTDFGADIIGGSLLKNPGGGLARTGGYICGRKELTELVSSYLIAPGLGFETTPNLGITREIFQGLFNSPHSVKEALIGNIYISSFLEMLNIETYPKYFEPHYDIILKIDMKDEKLFNAFIKSIQESSPIDSYVEVVPYKQEGYTHPIVMAGGTFTTGSSIEFSADGFYKNPFQIFYQAGLYSEQSRILAEKFFNKFISF